VTQDVWSYGVTAWELLSEGVTPYSAIPDDAAVVAHVTSGGVLPAPDTPGIRQLWDAVAPCFTLLPKGRPTFFQLGVALRAVPALLGPVPDGGVVVGRGPPKIILCPITKKVMNDPVTLPSRSGSPKVDICFEATAVLGFVVTGVNPITRAKGWARYDQGDSDVRMGHKAVGDGINLVQHETMSVACAAWRDRHAVAVRIDNLSGRGERPDRGKMLDLDPADTVTVVKAKISAFCKVPPEYQDLRLLHVFNDAAHIGDQRLDGPESIQEHPMFDVLPGAIVSLMPPDFQIFVHVYSDDGVRQYSANVNANIRVRALEGFIQVRRPTVSSLFVHSF
jgi:hypothetical protein